MLKKTLELIKVIKYKKNTPYKINGFTITASAGTASLSQAKWQHRLFLVEIPCRENSNKMFF